MGILNTVESMAKGHTVSERGRVAGALVDEVQQRGGIGCLIQEFERNGMRSFVEQWSRGQTDSPNPTAMESALAGSGIIANVAQRTGLSEPVVRSEFAVVIPFLIHHMVSNGYITPTGEPRGDQPQPAEVLQSVLPRIL